MILKIYDEAKRKEVVVGEIKDNVFYKKVTPNKHFMRKYGGYGIQYEALVRLRDIGIKKIYILQNGFQILESTVDDWWTKGGIDNLGNGKQIFLSTENMTINE